MPVNVPENMKDPIQRRPGTANFPVRERYYRVPVINPLFVFGPSMWNLNLWDMVSYRRSKGRLIEFETDDLVAWFQDRRYKGDQRNSIKKAFQYTLLRALRERLVKPALPNTGEPVEGLDDPKAALEFFTFEGVFSLNVPQWDSEAAAGGPNFLKPAGYLENGWAGLMPPASKAVLNLLLYDSGQGKQHVPMERIDTFLSDYMTRRRIRDGVLQLMGLELVAIDGEHVGVRTEKLFEPPPSEARKSTLSAQGRLYELLGDGVDPVRAERLLAVLREADLLGTVLKRPGLLRKAYGDMKRFMQKAPFSALITAARRWKGQDRRRVWEKIIAETAGLQLRLKAATQDATRIGRFDLWEGNKAEVTSLYAIDLRRTDFDQAEIEVSVARRTKAARARALPKGRISTKVTTGGGDTVTLDLVLEDGADNLLGRGSWAIDVQRLEAGKSALVRLDVTQALKTRREQLQPDDIPLLQLHWRSKHAGADLRATASLKLSGARYL